VDFRLRRIAADPAATGDGAISPDGSRFVAASKRNGSVNLWFCDVQTGRWHQATRGAGEDIEGQWAPDGTRIAFTSTRGGHKQIWLYDLASGRISQLTSGEHEEEYPSWSPDSRRILFAGGPWGRRHFYVVDAAGGPSRAVNPHPGRAGAGSWAPDGRWLVCHSYDTGAGAVFLLDSETGEQLPVTDGSSWDYKPAICPTRPVVAFSRSDEGRSVIWLHRLNDGVGRPLVMENADDRWPSWTRDGQHLFFHRLVDEARGISVWDRVDGSVRELVPASEQPRAGSLDPTGTRLVYASERSGRSALHVVDLATGVTRALAVGEAAFPAWSPVGERIAFCSRLDGATRWDVAVVDLDTGRVRVLTDAFPRLHGMHGPLSWSPDGTRLLFKSDTEPFEANLYEITPATGELRAVTDDAWWDEAPAYTPDGRGVVFMSTRGGDWTWSFCRKDIVTGAISTLAGPDYVERNNPRVLPDGALVSTLAAAGIEELYEQLPDGSGRVIAEAGEGVRYPAPSADGRLVVFTRSRRTVEFWIAENVWADGSPVADLGRPVIAPARPAPAIRQQAPLGPVRSPVDTRRR